MGYTLQVTDNLIRLKLEGDFTEADLEAYLQEFMPQIEGATAEQVRHVLVDVRQLGKLCNQARKEFTQLNNNPHFGKVGIIGINPFVRVLVAFVTKASSRNNSRFFSTEEEAIKWLNEDEM